LVDFPFVNAGQRSETNFAMADPDVSLETANR